MCYSHFCFKLQEVCGFVGVQVYTEVTASETSGKTTYVKLLRNVVLFCNFMKSLRIQNTYMLYASKTESMYI